MKTINYYMLEDKNACPEHLNRFRDTFGVGEVELSKKNLKIAQDVKLDILFLATFLSNEARAKYDRVCGEAWVEYKRVRGEASAKYERVCGEALIELLTRD